MSDKGNTGSSRGSSPNPGVHPVHKGEGGRAPKTVPTRPPKK